MKNYLILALALSLVFSALAQKKELKTATKALVKGDFEKAGVALDAAELLLDSMEDKYKSQYYLNRSVFYSKRDPELTINAGFDDLIKAIEALKYVTHPAAAEGLKIQQQQLRAHLVNTGSSLLNKSDYISSCNYFEAAYNLSPSDTIYLYYAASTAVNAKQYDRSLGIYESLRTLEFTGIEKKMFATNVETQTQESFDRKTLMDISIKAGTHINPVEELSTSKFPEIIKNIALIYVQNGETEKALEALALARAEDPDDLNLLLTEANVYYNMGDVVKFKELLEIAVKKDPNNAELQYNLGVIASEVNDFDNSKKYYLRAIELKSDYTNAYINLAALILSQEQEILDQMNKLGSSAADDRKYDQLKEQRKQMYLEAIPYLESAMVAAPDNFQAAKTLSNIYSAVGNSEKYKEFKALADSLESNQ